jgi:hypothetical protein
VPAFWPIESGIVRHSAAETIGRLSLSRLDTTASFEFLASCRPLSRERELPGQYPVPVAGLSLESSKGTARGRAAPMPSNSTLPTPHRARST